MYKGVEIVAEVKTHSPSGWVSPYSWDELFEIANQVGDILSIHTESPWGGSFDLLKKARSRTDKPILAKGIHARDKDIDKALNECDADYALAVGRVPELYAERCFIEPYTLQELGGLAVSQRTVWNSRDLRTRGLKSIPFSAAREVFKGPLYQASNVKRLADIDLTARGVIIGTCLPDLAGDLLSSQ
jgi:hypothetical protein